MLITAEALSELDLDMNFWLRGKESTAIAAIYANLVFSVFT